jgi:hypothetical protein
LWAFKDNKEIPFSISRCFPGSIPSRYISLRDNNGEEVTLLTDISTVDKAFREDGLVDGQDPGILGVKGSGEFPLKFSNI